jgi:hypothetical protein
LYQPYTFELFQLYGKHIDTNWVTDGCGFKVTKALQDPSANSKDFLKEDFINMKLKGYKNRIIQGKENAYTQGERLKGIDLMEWEYIRQRETRKSATVVRGSVGSDFSNSLYWRVAGSYKRRVPLTTFS